MNLVTRDSVFDVDKFFDNFFTPASYARRGGESSFFSPAVDIHDNGNDYSIQVDLPGVKKEDVNVQVHDGVLTIEASHSESNEEKKDGKVVLKERRTGKFMRSFSLGSEIHEEDINAKFNDGVLSVTVPKLREKAPAKKQIAVD